MASKRKSTVPCMIPLKNTHFQGDFEQDTQSTKDTDFPVREKGVKSSQSLDETFRQEQLANLKDCGFYTCRLCHFETEDLNLFLDHVYSGHPDIHTDPCFVCLDCGTSAAKFEGLALHNARVHPSTITTTLQLNKRDSRYIVEQSLCIKSCERSSSKDIEISITKTPIMRMLKCKSEPKRIVVSHHSTDNIPLSTTEVVEKNVPSSVMTTHVPAIVHNEAKAALPSAIQIVNGSGALPLLKTAVTQVVPVVQGKSLNQQSAPGTISSSHSSSSSAKILPKVMIPLSSIPTYNTSMDSSSFLKTSFSKFPYPTKAELCYLTVVTKYPEEQIKIWFTAQRLKQGISWSPEEIEDARKKMFNTIIQTTHSNGQQQSQTNHTGAQPTITVLGTTGIPQILQGSLVGQGGVIVTQPMMANGVQVSSAPVTLAVNTTDSNKASFQSDGLNVKENSKAKADANNKKNTSSTPTTTDNIAPKTSESPSPVSVNSHAISNNNMDAKTKKSQEQLAALKESFLASQFPDQEEVDRHISLTCLSVREVRKWFSDRRYHLKNLKGSKLTSQPVSTSPDNSQQDSFHQTETSTPPERPKTPQQSPLTPSQSSQVTPTKRPHRNQSPDFTAIRYKEREPGQVRALEASFAIRSGSIQW
ncbi:hypothetical protein DNTS_009950 [Danionella cerebrum]|uniref:Homeobox domain-containing protein n=1 Tax=Danionella cerebrum TaxID=2873325 RepID=A0A553N447_9TELE|nr:hypothetical protein DNTS_009950 [Danionella translucida]